MLRETRIEEYGKDLRRSTDIASDLSLEHGVSVTCMLVPQAAWETGDRPFIRAVAMDAIIASSDLLTNTRS